MFVMMLVACAGSTDAEPDTGADTDTVPVGVSWTVEVRDLLESPLPGAEVCGGTGCTTTGADGLATVSLDSPRGVATIASGDLLGDLYALDTVSEPGAGLVVLLPKFLIADALETASGPWDEQATGFISVGVFADDGLAGVPGVEVTVVGGEPLYVAAASLAMSTEGPTTESGAAVVPHLSPGIYEVQLTGLSVDCELVVGWSTADPGSFEVEVRAGLSSWMELRCPSEAS